MRYIISDIIYVIQKYIYTKQNIMRQKVAHQKSCLQLWN